MTDAPTEMINVRVEEVTHFTMTNMSMEVNFKVALLLVLITLLLIAFQLKISIDMMEIADHLQYIINNSTYLGFLVKDHKVIIYHEGFHHQTALLAGDSSQTEGLDMVLEEEGVIAIEDEKLVISCKIKWKGSQMPKSF
jgi:hypothetical protein